MNYSEFKLKSERKDANINDKLHFFSSCFKSLVAFVLYKIGASANMATAIFGAVGIVASVSFYNEFYLLGYFLFRLHIIIDMADGSIARAKQQFSEYADGYDKVNHILVNASIILALSKYADYYTTLIVLPVFLVYYLFPKLFAQYPKGVNVGFNSVLKSLLKNILAFEGFILLHTFNGYFQLGHSTIINLIYAALFIFLSIAKYRYMLRNEK